MLLGVAASFFLRIFRADGQGDSATCGELRGHDRFARCACFHKIVQNAVRDRFVKRALVPIRSEIKLERLTFHAKARRNVIDVYSGKIRLAGDRANRSEIVRFEMNPVTAARRGIWKGLKPGLGRGSWNFRFALSENCQSTCAFCFCHSNIKVRPKAIEVNRPYLVEMRADRQPRPDIFRQMRRHRQFPRRLAPRLAILCLRPETSGALRLCAPYEKYCLE